MSADLASTSPAASSAAASSGRDPALLALIVGLVGLAISAFGLIYGIGQGDARPFLGYLIGASFWLSMGIGMLFLVMLGWAFDAGWSVVLRRQQEHFLAIFPWLAMIFLPLLVITIGFSQNDVVAWPWIDQSNITPSGGTVAGDPLYTAKAPYLNLPFFTGRFIFFFAVWCGISLLLRKYSFALDEDGDPKWVHKSRFWAAVGIILTALATSFAAIDWYKTLEYHWFSTMYGVWFFSGCMRAGLAGTLLLCVYLSTGNRPLAGIFNRTHSYYLGCLMLAFTVFWAYISFSQYFLQYGANIPEETYWYNMRMLYADGTFGSTWWYVMMALIGGYFLIPFLWLLWYPNKFGKKIVLAAVWILAFHLLDLYWNILPAKLYDAESVLGYSYRQFVPSIWDFTTLIGVGGICLWAFFRSYRKTRPIPIRDPRIRESIDLHE